MDHAPFSHPAHEISVGCGSTYLTIRKNAIAHTQAGATGRIGHAETCFHEDINQPFLDGLTEYFRSGRGKYPSHIRGKLFPLQYLGRHSQVLKAAVGAGAEV